MITRFLALLFCFLLLSLCVPIYPLHVEIGNDELGNLDLADVSEYFNHDDFALMASTTAQPSSTGVSIETNSATWAVSLVNCGTSQFTCPSINQVGTAYSLSSQGYLYGSNPMPVVPVGTTYYFVLGQDLPDKYGGLIFCSNSITCGYFNTTNSRDNIASPFQPLRKSNQTLTVVFDRAGTFCYGDRIYAGMGGCFIASAVQQATVFSVVFNILLSFIALFLASILC